MIQKIIYFILLLVPFGSFGQNILIKNGHLLTITQGDKEKSDILILNGKIIQIANNITAPKNVQVIDASDMYVMPGIVDAHSHIALEAVNEMTSPVTAEVSMADVLNPFDIAVYRALAGGVTISHAMHGSANAIGGQCQTIKHRYGVTNPGDLHMKGAPRTIK